MRALLLAAAILAAPVSSEARCRFGCLGPGLGRSMDASEPFESGRRSGRNAYGLGVDMDRFGRAHRRSDPFQEVRPNAHGLGVGMDQYGRAVRHDPWGFE